MSGRGGRSVHVCSPSSRRVVVELSGPGGHLRGPEAILGARRPLSSHSGQRPSRCRGPEAILCTHAVSRLNLHLDLPFSASRSASRLASHLGLRSALRLASRLISACRLVSAYLSLPQAWAQSAQSLRSTPPVRFGSLECAILPSCGATLDVAVNSAREIRGS